MSERYPQRKSGGSWKKGHIPWNKGLTKETDKRIKNVGEKIKLNAIKNENFGNRNKKFTEEHRKAIGIANTNKKRTDEMKRIISKANSGRKFSQEVNKKKGLKGELNPFYGKHHDEETMKRIRKRIINWWKIPENREKILNDEMLSRRLKGLIKRPTKPEQSIVELIEPNNLPITYTGDGKVIIEGFNPDFMDNNGFKKIIEVFGDWWHANPDKYDRNNLYPIQQSVVERDKKRLEAYSRLGFDTLIIWEHELKEKEITLKKIKEFLGDFN